MFPHRRLRRPGPKRLNCRTCRRRSNRADTGAGRAAAIGRCDRPRADASERSCQGVAIARNRAIFTRLCARGVHGRRRSHLSAGDDRVRGDCYFRLGVRGHALAASAQGPQSSRIRMGNFEHTIPTCPGVSRLRFKDTGTTHSSRPSRLAKRKGLRRICSKS